MRRHRKIVQLSSHRLAGYSPQASIAQYWREIDLGELMLAAVPSDADRRLELFRLALLLNSRSNAELPSALATYFNEILSQARSLILDPNRISNLQMPQAIQLANEMLSNDRLRALLEGVESIDDMSRERAERALLTLEPELASAD